MRLPAMMDLVLEEMHQETVASLGLDACTAIDPHGAVKLVGHQRIAMSDQTLVDFGLVTLQVCHGWTRHAALPGPWTQRAPLERIDVEKVDDVDVVQGQLQTGEEARSPRLKLRLAQICTCVEQAMIGPGVVVGKCTIGLDKSG